MKEEMEKQKYEEIRASIEQNKELVHDTKNHYLVISEYVKNQEYEKLENIIKYKGKYYKIYEPKKLD